MSLLTIILPNYNYLNGFIKNYEQLNLQKDYNKKNIKILISDDSDNPSIHTFFKSQISWNDQYKYGCGPKIGAVPNWNSSLSKVDTKYTMFIHHDEYIASEYFLKGVSEILENGLYDLIILPLVKEKGKKRRHHYPRLLKWIFVKYPFLLFTCNPFGSPSVIIYRNSITQEFDENLRWMVDVEWYYRFLIRRPKILLIQDEKLEIVSNLNFTDTETNKMDVRELILSERKYILKKYNFRRIVFSKVFNVLKIPVKLKEFF